MQNKSDVELMSLINEGYRPALEELYDRYIKLVYSFAFKSTNRTRIHLHFRKEEVHRRVH